MPPHQSAPLGGEVSTSGAKRLSKSTFASTGRYARYGESCNGSPSHDKDVGQGVSGRDPSEVAWIWNKRSDEVHRKDDVLTIKSDNGCVFHEVVVLTPEPRG